MSERQKSLDRVAQMIEKIQDRSEEDAVAFISEFVDTISEPLKKVPEPVFREIFLPYFTGEKKATAEQNAVAHWSGLVGGATSPAEVVDVSGKTLFIVPPLYDSSILNTAADTNKSFKKIFLEAAEESRVRPAETQRILAEGLSEKADAILQTTQSKYSWDPVFAYYNLIPAAQAAQSSSTPQQPVVEDEFDFDE
jgi:hypothetical protein